MVVLAASTAAAIATAINATGISGMPCNEIRMTLRNFMFLH
jgi:hypothetical protein